MNKKKYGSVYTPHELSLFVSELLLDEVRNQGLKVSTILDPACGEGALLKTFKSINENKDSSYCGVDIDQEAIDFCSQNFKDSFSFYNENFILPKNRTCKSVDYWKEVLPNISIVISNPPWSKERIYDDNILGLSGFELNKNQYDAYVLFIESTIKLVSEGSLIAFIIPDSIFDTQNSHVRKYILETTKIKVIARLGEKLFPSVNRATTVIICQKGSDDKNRTKCFRLNTQDRKLFLEGKLCLKQAYENNFHYVLQERFSLNKSNDFDIDIKEEEEFIIEKIHKHGTSWQTDFKFGRGIEISKSGLGTICSACGCWQPILKKELGNKRKCVSCLEKYLVTEETVSYLLTEKKGNGEKKIIVGENLQRYKIHGCKYIKSNLSFLNYKNDIFSRKDSIILRKTGLGIYASLNTEQCFTTQSVYVLKPLKEDISLYYLGILNSRLIYYFYMMKFGENEWKSHPYLTKGIIFSLPIKRYEKNDITDQIKTLVKELLENYTKEKDLTLENLIFKLYNIKKNERQLIIKRLQALPKELTAVAEMRYMEN